MFFRILGNGNIRKINQEHAVLEVTIVQTYDYEKSQWKRNDQIIPTAGFIWRQAFSSYREEDKEHFEQSSCFRVNRGFPEEADCFTNGTMAALAVKVESVPSLSPSQLTLRDQSCRPLQSDAINVVFYFNVNSSGTTRRFDNNHLTYENEVLFTSYRLRVACHYLVNDTKVVQFLYQNNPAPVVQPGLGDLAVIMRLALDSTYNDFYGTRDYPVVKYLRRPLYFEFQDELASTIEHAVKAALHTVLCAITEAVGSKFTEFRVEMAGKEKENEMAGKKKENELLVYV
ncbi:UNVERIFIED_CONTAM: hypothetical protein FKN15_058852 [Acipenser sinensis]